ncbi:hypothetical protein DFS33DRAFT_1370009 [Desarmillaria ectypa]|nr:hypothetical protein DFS33DRAFT_1370009 [Desarmillaria ectypa]
MSKHRSDEYGGSFENRIRLPLDPVVEAMRSVIPDSMPLFYRIFFPDIPSWSEETVRYVTILAKHGVEFLDVSSGGNHAQQKIATSPAYQARFSHVVKKRNPGLLVEVLDKGQADVILVGRQFLKNPGLIRAAHQIRWGFGEKWNL